MVPKDLIPVFFKRYFKEVAHQLGLSQNYSDLTPDTHSICLGWSPESVWSLTYQSPRLGKTSEQWSVKMG